MPLVKKVAIPSRGSANRTTFAKTVSRKATSKSDGAFKGKQPGKKVEKKPPRYKAGYELYSDGDSQEERHAFGGLGDLVKTLVEDYQSMEALDVTLTESAPGVNVDYVVEKHPPNKMDKGTPFNKRLVSSTPDPERLVDTAYPQHISQPEGNNFGAAAPLRPKEGNASTMLSESERECLRQQMDAALVEEVQSKNVVLQEHLKKLLISQKQQVRAGVSSSVASAVGQPASNRGLISADAISERLHGGLAVRALTKRDEPALPSQQSSDPNAAFSSVSIGRAGQPHDRSRSKDPSSSSEVGPRDMFRGSDIGAFQHFLHRESADLPPPSLLQATHQGTHTRPQNAVPNGNISMGFIPGDSGDTAVLNPPPSRNPSSTTVSLPKARPSSPATIENTPIYTHTPLPSPNRGHERQLAPDQTSNRSVVSGNAPRRLQFISHENYDSNGLAQGPIHTVYSVSTGGEAENSEISEACRTGGRLPTSHVGTNGVSYTSDGYYINHTAEAEERDSDSTPRSQVPLPSGMVTAHHKKQRPTSTQSNRNNSGYNAAQLNTNQNKKSMNPPGKQILIPQQRQAEEAVAGGGPSGLAGDRMSAEVEKVLQEEYLRLQSKKVPPQYTSLGPLHLRAAIAQLKACADKGGDRSVKLLVQKVIETVEWLPQLKEGFSMEDFKKLEAELHRQRRRANNLNEIMRQMERSRTNTDSYEEMLKEMIEGERSRTELALRVQELEGNYVQLQEEKSALMAEVSDMEERLRKQQETFGQQHQKMLFLLKQKEHEALVSRQEQLQQTKYKTQELERMGLRNQSLQNKLSAADSEKSIQTSMLKQRDMQITSLEESLTKMKQAASEVMQHLEKGSSEVKNLPCCRILQDLLQSTPCSRYHTLTSNALDISGNHRIIKPTTGRSENENKNNVYNSKLLSNAKQLPSAQQMIPTKETESYPQARSGTLLKEITNTKEKEAKAFSPTSLTVSAIAAHNEKLGKLHKKGHTQSVHSWDGVRLKKVEAANQSLTYHSDTESMAVPQRLRMTPMHKHDHIRLWSLDVDSERPDTAEDLTEDTDQSTPSPKNSPPSHDKSHDKTDLASVTGSIPTLSEVPISQEKTGSILETGSIPSLSEVPISEAGLGESGKSVKSLAEVGQGGYTSTQKPQTNPSDTSLATTRYASSPPASPTKEKEAAAAEKAAEKNAASVSTLDTSLTPTVSNLTQRGYFHGTELDMSMSTIPEDLQSTATGFTGVSVRSINSVDNAKFTEKLTTLDDRIALAKQQLHKFKKAMG